MTIKELKESMTRELKLTNDSSLAYITEELLLDYLFNPAEEVVKTPGCSVEESKDAAATSGCNYGTYANSLVTQNGYIYYKANDKGTPRYGCGDKNWKWRLDVGDYYNQVGTCPSGKTEYLICCPSC